MTVRAIRPADLPALVATWEAQRQVLANLSGERYQAWDLEECRAFFAGSIARIDTASASFCALVPRDGGRYEVVGGIKTTNVVAFGKCFKACAALLPLTTVVFGRIPASAPPQAITWLNARFPHTTTDGVITWEDTIANVRLRT